MNPYEIIIRPIDTEKVRYQSSELGQYTFEVHLGANKIEVKRAIEAIYDVKIAKVNTMIMPAKISRRSGRRRVIHQSGWKKAIVTVAEGERMSVFEGV